MLQPQVIVCCGFPWTMLTVLLMRGCCCWVLLFVYTYLWIELIVLSVRLSGDVVCLDSLGTLLIIMRDCRHWFLPVSYLPMNWVIPCVGSNVCQVIMIRLVCIVLRMLLIPFMRGLSFSPFCACLYELLDCVICKFVGWSGLCGYSSGNCAKSIHERLQWPRASQSCLCKLNKFMLYHISRIV